MIPVQIMFGKVVAVNDDQKLHRVKVSIQGYTDQIAIDDLHWYYPFFGVNYIPIINDQVPVLIFNNDFTTGFFNNKVDLEAIEYDDSEYENYLEIYKRLGVQLTYNETDGIRFINQKSLVQIEDGRASMYVEDNQITLNKDRIDLGTDGEPAPLGDMTVEAFAKYMDAMQTQYEKIMDCLDAIKQGCVTPHTKGIQMGLIATMPIAENTVPSKHDSAKQYSETIRSKKVFVE